MCSGRLPETRASLLAAIYTAEDREDREDPTSGYFTSSQCRPMGVLDLPWVANVNQWGCRVNQCLRDVRGVRAINAS